MRWAFLAGLLLASPVRALDRDSFLDKYRSIEKQREQLLLQSKNDEAEQALKELRDFLDTAAREAASSDAPATYAELSQRLALAAAVSNTLSSAGEFGLLTAEQTATLKALLPKAAAGWIRQLSLGELRRYPPEGSWGGYFAGKLKNFRAAVESASEVELLSNADSQALYQEAVPINEGFFLGKFKAALDRIKADPADETQYKNLRVYLYALGEFGSEFAGIAPLSSEFLKARQAEFEALLAGLTAPLEAEVTKSDGSAYLEDASALSAFQQSADYKEGGAIVSRYRQREEQYAQAESDPVAGRIYKLLLLQAKKPYLDLYAKWYDEKYQGGQGASAKAAGLKIQGAAFAKDPALAHAIADLGGKNKEDGRKASWDWIRQQLGEAKTLSEQGDPKGMEEAKKALDFATAYLPDDSFKVRDAISKILSAQFQKSKAANDLEALMQTRVRAASLGNVGDVAAMDREINAAASTRYREAVAARSIEEMIRLANLGQTGLTALDYPIAVGRGTWDQDIKAIVSTHYDAAKAAGNLAEMYRDVAFGQSGFAPGSYPVTGGKYADDASEILAARIKDAIAAQDVSAVQEAYTLAQDPKLSLAKKNPGLKLAAAFLEAHGVSVTDGLASAAATNDQQAEQVAEGEKPPEKSAEDAALADYESVKEHPISGSPKGYPGIQGLPAAPPSGIRRGRKVLGFEETVDFRVTDHWGKVETPYKWVYSHSFVSAGQLKLDVVRVWHLDDEGAASEAAGADADLVEKRYARLELRAIVRTLAIKAGERELAAIVLKAGEDAPWLAGAIRRRAGVLDFDNRNLPAWDGPTAKVLDFVEANDKEISKRIDKTLAQFAQTGVVVTPQGYDQAVAGAVSRFLEEHPKGMPDILKLLGLDYDAMAAAARSERRQRLANYRKSEPDLSNPYQFTCKAQDDAVAGISVGTGAGEINGWISRYEAAIGAFKGQGSLVSFSKTAEELLKGFVEMFRRSTTSLVRPPELKYRGMENGSSPSPVYFDGTLKAEKGHWLRGCTTVDPNMEIANWLAMSLSALLAKQGQALESVAQDTAKEAVKLDQEKSELARPKQESQRYKVKDRVERVEKARDPQKLMEAPKSENVDDRIGELDERLSRIREDGRKAESDKKTLEEVHPKLALEAKAEEKAEKLKPETQSFESAAGALKRIHDAIDRANEAVRVIGSGAFLDETISYTYTQSMEGGDFSTWLQVAEQPPAPPGAKAEEYSARDLLKDANAKLDSIEIFTAQAPKARAVIEDRLDWERRFKKLADEIRDAARAARWSPKAAAEIDVHKLLDDPMIRERIDTPGYEAAKREIGALADERAGSLRAARVEAAQAQAREEGCGLSKLKAAIVEQFKAYERGDVAGFMKNVSPRFQGHDRFMLGLNRNGLERSIRADLRNLKEIQFDVAVDPPRRNGGSGEIEAPMTWAIRAKLGTTNQEWIVQSQRSTLRYECQVAGAASAPSAVAQPAFAPPPPAPPATIEGQDGGRARAPRGPPPHFQGPMREAPAPLPQPAAPSASPAESPAASFLLTTIDGENIFGRSNYVGATVVDRGTVQGQAVAAPVGVLNGTVTMDPKTLVGLPGVAGTPGAVSGPPSIQATAVSPNSAFVGDATPLAISGAGFATGSSLAVVVAPGAPNACAFRVSNAAVASAQQLNFTLTLDPDALGVSGSLQPAVVPIQVTNGNGATATLSSAFTVVEPSISSVTPYRVRFSSSAAVTVTGANLRPSLTYGLLSTDPATAATNVTRVSDVQLSATLNGMSAAGSFSLFLYETGTAPLCSPINAQAGVTLRGAGRADYRISP